MRNSWFQWVSKMSASSSRVLIFAGVSLLLTMPACNSGPSHIRPPSVSASGAADEAMELYDADADGFLAGPELDKVPGLKAAMDTLDADSDGKVSGDEIAARIEACQASGIGVALVLCTVKMDGQPLAGATVTFEPESFLGDAVLAGDGVTEITGMVKPRIPKEKRPVSDMPGGLQPGFYRIKVSKQVNGKETVPAMYNTESTLGQQIAVDDPAVTTGRLLLNLKSQ